MASPHGLTFTANGFSPSNWETWEEVPWDAKDTVQDAVQADSWSWTEPLIQALQRVQKLQGTGRTELSFEALKLQTLEPFLEVQALPRQLTKLSLRDNPWQDPALLLSQLQPLHQLISLDLSKCRLDSLTHLPRLQLRHLRLEENQLRSTLGIAGCPRLLEVSLARNRLTSTEQLETLLELRVLDLAENCLTSSQRCLRPLAACTQLSELHLQGNPLAKDVTLRSLFPSLETLDSRPLRRSRGGVATPVVPTAVPAPRGPWRDDGAVATEYLGKTKCYARRRGGSCRAR
ncbi:unnamed protein product [Cladocopium goreaui]|uniref:Leucine-rich repeat and IQ domain-containing protein 1 n=1 Tax=Cladocopium goreaui TaxID=2562237 RepID=A0A9P1CT65_9DINO|nr:unnamed protein product [Cladocopium goreaui]